MHRMARRSSTRAAIEDAECWHWSAPTDGFRNAWSRARANCRSRRGHRSSAAEQTNYTIKVFIGRLECYVKIGLEIHMKKMLSIALLLAGAALLSGSPKKHNVIEPPA